MSDLIFYANRTDGLGERLRAMLVAMTLAEKSGTRFKFYWDSSKKNNEHHATGAPEDIFSERFLERYFQSLEGKQETRLLKEFFTDAQRSGPYCAPVAFPKEMPENMVSAQDVIRAFEEIEFSPPLAEAVSEAKNVALPENTVALHLRAGDIVYGGFKDLAQYFRKVVPYTLANRLIQQCLGEGKAVLVFGQDAGLIEQLGQTKGVLSAADYMPEDVVTPAQKAMFDMVLMSRCKTIYAGSSGFALFAGLISGTEVIDPYSSWSNDDALRDILGELDSPSIPVSNEQVAFACKAAFLLNCQNRLGDERWLKVLRAGRRYDESNLLFWLSETSVLCELGRVDEAKPLADALLQRYGDHLRKYFSRLVRNGRWRLIYRYRLFEALVKISGEHQFAASLIDTLGSTQEGKTLIKKISRRKNA